MVSSMPETTPAKQSSTSHQYKQQVISAARKDSQAKYALSTASQPDSRVEIKVPMRSEYPRVFFKDHTNNGQLVCLWNDDEAEIIARTCPINLAGRACRLEEGSCPYYHIRRDWDPLYKQAPSTTPCTVDALVRPLHASDPSIKVAHVLRTCKHIVKDGCYKQEMDCEYAHDHVEIRRDRQEKKAEISAEMIEAKRQGRSPIIALEPSPFE
ncbi:hypothetical protein TI39_contig410g00006 [Zymoseptoria brevis]|uniref:C3H1-type domain-containing protein n=1 Tax=Zymoseptoria brevis TaxID=1047168 RepID=A0A0F4GN62_9PEZI|nr:hypothetical protein TI39_contig410g00006 [Zymoseptoria brevis]